MIRKLLIILFIITLTIIPVKAEEYETKVLIPKNTTATVKTEKFNYIDFTYSNLEQNKGIITFQNIQNNTLSKTAVSINMLLFDSSNKNIGLLTYCSDKDISSEYSGYKLGGLASSFYTITVNKKYLVENKNIEDIAYISVLDENRYCQIGGYSKYAGLTIEEIKKGTIEVETNNTISDFLLKIQRFFSSKNTLFIIGLVIFLFINGLILNVLCHKMVGKTTILSYLPITNAYISMKLSFGKIVSLIYIITYIIGIALLYFNMNILFIIVTIIQIISLIVVLIKIATKNYDLFILEPSIKDSSFDTVTSYDGYDNGTTIDLTYQDKETDLEEEFTISKGANETINNIEEDQKEKEDESDLGKLFH